MSAAPDRRWLLTLADLMALLLTFFVLIFSMKKIPEGDWAKMQESMQNQLHTAQTSTTQSSDGMITTPAEPTEAGLSLSYLAHLLEVKLEHASLQSAASLKLENGYLRISLSSDVFFAPGSAEITSDSLPLLSELTDALIYLPNRIEIIGHTDPDPIATKDYPSNYALSLSRAWTVRQLLKERGYMDSIAALGAADSDFIPGEDYAKARRVDLIVHEVQ